MSKKGFTLVEITVVIAIVAFISTASIITFNQITDKVNNNELEDLITQIELATDVYFNVHTEYITQLYESDGSDVICTRLYKLQQDGLIDMNLINPITDERISGTMCVYSSLDENKNIIHEFEIE